MLGCLRLGRDIVLAVKLQDLDRGPGVASRQCADFALGFWHFSYTSRFDR
jgi:hypothetical protein